MAAASKKEQLFENAVKIFNKKKEAAEAQYKETVAKVEEAFDKQVDTANAKYDEFVSKVDEDTDKRLNIVNKVIDAESEERRWKAEQEEMKKQRELAEAAEKKMAAEAEAARQAEEEKQRRIAEKKAEKARQKILKMRAKVPVPEGFVKCKNSKSLYAKLKKINSAGRYGFCCFYLAKDKEYVKYCEELSGEFNDNVGWFDCEIKDNNFEEAMLLYEFNSTPAIVVCFEGKPSNLHRYVIGDTEESRECLKRYAEKANAE